MIKYKSDLSLVKYSIKAELIWDDLSWAELVYKYLQIWLDSHSSVVKNILKWNEMNPMKIKIKLKLLTVFFKKTCTFEDTSDTYNQRLPIKNTIFGHSHIYAPEVWILSWQTLVNNPSISNTMCQKLTPDRR